MGMTVNLTDRDRAQRAGGTETTIVISTGSVPSLR